jgi:hypothetical protein
LAYLRPRCALAYPSSTGLQSVSRLVIALITAFETFFTPESTYKANYVANDDYDVLDKKVTLLLQRDPSSESLRREVLADLDAANKRLRLVL